MKILKRKRKTTIPKITLNHSLDAGKAIAISESNTSMVVVGIGEHAALCVMTYMSDGVYKSTDGGKSFKPMPTPHGNNHHLWINPNHNSKMIISNNDGKSCNTQQNQTTSQFYRLITDNLVPYNVYGGQQDNSLKLPALILSKK